MTDRPGTAGKTTKSGSEAPLWSVDGNSDDPTGKGLDDTVVRMPKITDDGPEPESPAPPKPSTKPLLMIVALPNRCNPLSCRAVLSARLPWL